MSRSSSDRYRRSDRDYRNRDYRSERDSRDSYKSDYSRRRVPGLVADPDSYLGDADRAIDRGQRETIIRVQSDRYSASRSSKPTKDTMSSTLPAYKPSLMTVSQPYYPSSLRRSYDKRPKRKLYNPGFLSFLLGLVGCGLLITAVVYVEWTTRVTMIDSDFRVDYKGLFQACTYLVNTQTYAECKTLEDFVAGGSQISSLEQATRGLIIIAAVVALVSIIVSFIFGLHKFERAKGAVIGGTLYAFAGACGVAGMGCFSALLVDEIEGTKANGVAMTFAGACFYFAWTGTGLLIIASITSFLSHCAHWK